MSRVARPASCGSGRSSGAPAASRALLGLYRAYRGAKASAQTLAERVSDGFDLTGIESYHLPGEEVAELIQRHGNYFPELEEGAERLWRDAGLPGEDLFTTLARSLHVSLGVTARIEKVQTMRGAVRRYDPARKKIRE